MVGWRGLEAWLYSIFTYTNSLANGRNVLRCTTDLNTQSTHSLVVVVLPVGGVGLGQLAFEALFGEQLDELLLERADVAPVRTRAPAHC